MPERAGYSGKALHEKLGLQPGGRAWLIHAPDDYFKWLELKPKDLELASRPAKAESFIHLFVNDVKILAPELARAAKPLAKDGMLWVSWRKGKVDGFSDAEIRAWALAHGLVDLKVCAVSAEWSGLKLVHRKERR